MLKMCSSERCVGRVKHLDARHHFLRFQTTEGKCTLEYVDTKENVADILTKPLPRETHLRHTARLVWWNSNMDSPWSMEARDIGARS